MGIFSLAVLKTLFKSFIIIMIIFIIKRCVYGTGIDSAEECPEVEPCLHENFEMPLFLLPMSF